MRWQLLATAWLGCAPAAAAVPIAGTTVVLAAGGEPKATIVIPKGSDALLCNGVSQAAQELSQFVAEMAQSAPLPIVVDDEQGAMSARGNVPGGSVVFVGAVPWALEIAGFDASALEQEGVAVFAHNASWLFVLGRSDGRDGDRHECGSDWCASLALPPLPLIVSYKFNKSLCGTGAAETTPSTPPTRCSSRSACTGWARTPGGTSCPDEIRWWPLLEASRSHKLLCY